MEVRRVTSKRDLQRFIRFPHQLYREDPSYVPQLNLMQQDLLSSRVNPFFKHSEAACFLVEEGGMVLGRIAAIYNKAHLDLYRDGTGFFGFFDAVNDKKVAEVLVGAACDFLRTKQVRAVVGPENLTTNDSLGILTEGFQQPPIALMPYNFPYYKDLLESQNMEPLLKLFSYYIDHKMLHEDFYPKFELLEGRLQKKGIEIRPMDFKHFKNEVSLLRIAYNQANEGNWGFLPLSEEEFLHMAKDLRQLIEPENVFLAKYKGEVIGYSVTLPNINQVLKNIPNGKLFPLGWWYLLRAKRYIDSMRIMILGVLPNWRHGGIDWCLYAHIARTARKKNILWGEACYVMDVNAPMNKMMQRMGGKVVKTYQLYRKEL